MVASTAVWTGKLVLPVPNIASAANIGSLVFTGSSDGELKKWSLTNGVLKNEGTLNLELVVGAIQGCADRVFCQCTPKNTWPQVWQIIGVDPATMETIGNFQDVSTFTTTETDLVIGGNDNTVTILNPADFTVKFNFTTNQNGLCSISVFKNSFAVTDYTGNLCVYDQKGALSTTTELNVKFPLALQSLEDNRLVLGARNNTVGPSALQFWRTDDEQEQQTLIKFTDIPLDYSVNATLFFPDEVILASILGLGVYGNSIDFPFLGLIQGSPTSGQGLYKIDDKSFLLLNYGDGLYLYQKGVSQSWGEWARSWMPF